MESYSSEFRGAVLAACDANEGTREIAIVHCAVSFNSFTNWSFHNAATV